MRALEILFIIIVIIKWPAGTPSLGDDDVDNLHGLDTPACPVSAEDLRSLDHGSVTVGPWSGHTSLTSEC